MLGKVTWGGLREGNRSSALPAELLLRGWRLASVRKMPWLGFNDLGTSSPSSPSSSNEKTFPLVVPIAQMAHKDQKDHKDQRPGLVVINCLRRFSVAFVAFSSYFHYSKCLINNSIRKPMEDGQPLAAELKLFVLLSACRRCGAPPRPVAFAPHVDIDHRYLSNGWMF